MPSFDPTGVSEAAGVLIGGAELYSSLRQKKKDEAELASIHNPFYKIQDEYYANRNQAANLAESGMPAAEKDYMTSESGRGLSAGIGGILQGGGNVNDINKLFDTYGKSIDRTASKDAEQHINNINNFWNINKDLAGQKTTQWALNDYQPTMEKKKQLSENISADKQNVNNAINTAVGSLSAGATGMQNNSMLNALNKNNSLLEGLFPNQSSTSNPVITGNKIGGLEGIPTPEQFQLMNP